MMYLISWSRVPFSKYALRERRTALEAGVPSLPLAMIENMRSSVLASVALIACGWVSGRVGALVELSTNFEFFS